MALPPSLVVSGRRHGALGAVCRPIVVEHSRWEWLAWLVDSSAREKNIW
jgi:hypothetical protein